MEPIDITLTFKNQQVLDETVYPLGYKDTITVAKPLLFENGEESGQLKQVEEDNPQSKAEFLAEHLTNHCSSIRRNDLERKASEKIRSEINEKMGSNDIVLK